MDDGDAGVKVPVGFDLGRVCATPGAMRAIEQTGQIPKEFLERHLGGDWGELDPHDSRINDAALESGEDRIFSAYLLGDGVSKIWVITERDRSSTTILTPDEY